MPGPQAPVEVGPEHVAIVTALAQLDRDQREVVVLHHLADLGTAQIAAELGIPEGTVKSRLAGLAAGWPSCSTRRRSSAMSDLEQLRDLTEQVRAPSFRSLDGTARRRDRRSAMTALVGGALVVLLVLGGFLTSRSDNRSVEPVEPDPDRTQTVIEASYGDQSVHRFEAHEVRNTGDHAGASDLSLSADFYEGSTFAYWCSGAPDLSYLVRVTGGTDDPHHVGVWRAGGACDGSAGGHGEGYTGTGPPQGPSSSIGSQLLRFSPVPADRGNPTTVRIVLTDRIPDVVTGCFDLPGGPIPAECRDESSVHVLRSAGDVDFGAVIFARR